MFPEARHVAPIGTGEHAPSIPATLHAWQSVLTPSPQPLLQQTPSTQKSLTHSLPALHPVPLVLGKPNTYAEPGSMLALNSSALAPTTAVSPETLTE